MIGLWGPMVRRMARVATAIWLIVAVLSLAACLAIRIDKKDGDTTFESDWVIPGDDDPAEEPEEEEDDRTE